MSGSHSVRRLADDGAAEQLRGRMMLCRRVDVLPIENDFFRFYRLR